MNEDADIEEFLRALDSLIAAQIARGKPVRTWDELDDLAASLALSRLPSTD
ncbi:MAG: hypothetical protein ABIU05_27450 [Nitrospirales bacterium]